MLTRDIQLLQIFIMHKASEHRTSDSNTYISSDRGHRTLLKEGTSEIPDYSDYSAVTGTLKPASF